jgi:hypothetical protein
MECEEAIVKGKRIALIYPDWFLHSRLVPSLGKNVQGVAVAANDVFRLSHLFLKDGIVGREPVTAIRSFNEE